MSDPCREAFLKRFPNGDGSELLWTGWKECWYSRPVVPVDLSGIRVWEFENGAFIDGEWQKAEFILKSDLAHLTVVPSVTVEEAERLIRLSWSEFHHSEGNVFLPGEMDDGLAKHHAQTIVAHLTGKEKV